MQESVRDDCLKRLSYIDGHLHGVQRMIQEDAYCVDVLRQAFSAPRACASEGIRDGRDQQVVDELLTLYELANR